MDSLSLDLATGNDLGAKISMPPASFDPEHHRGGVMGDITAAWALEVIRDTRIWCCSAPCSCSQLCTIHDCCCPLCLCLLRSLGRCRPIPRSLPPRCA